MLIDGFDWDAGNLTKCQKHGVSIEEIESLFFGPHQLAPDHKHSMGEARQLAIGRAASGRPLFVVFTMRLRDGKSMLRPISARYMHGKEIERYEQTGS